LLRGNTKEKKTKSAETTQLNLILKNEKENEIED
jgi:hypothetical protein